MWFVRERGRVMECLVFRVRREESVKRLNQMEKEKGERKGGEKMVKNLDRRSGASS